MNKCYMERGATWFSVLFLSIFLASCQKPKEVIGDNLVSDAERLGLAITDTLSLNLVTVREDSLRSDKLSVMQIGAYNDVETGSYNVASSVHLRLSTLGINFGDTNNIVVDSVRLLLAYNGTSFLGDSTFNLRLSVKELDTDIVYDSNYYTNTPIAVKGENLLINNPVGYKFLPTTNTVYDGDTLGVPVLVLPIKNSFGEMIIAKGGQPELVDNESFISYFKGIRIKAEATPSYGQGFVMGINPFSIYSTMFIYYRDTVLKDTAKFELFINNNSASVATVEANIDGSVAGNFIANPNQMANKAFVKSGGVLKTIMTIPYLEELNKIEGLAVNQAQLELPLFENNDGIETPHTQLFLSVFNKDSTLIITPDLIEGEAFFGGTIQNGKYVFRISQYVQQVLRGVYPNLGVRIVARNSGITSNRTILSTENSFNSKPKLIITYSRF